MFLGCLSKISNCIGFIATMIAMEGGLGRMWKDSVVTCYGTKAFARNDCGKLRKPCHDSSSLVLSFEAGASRT
jgi:hypothetical protein